MPSAAIPAARRFAKLPAWPVIRGHDVRQFVQACLLACTDAIPVARADLDPALRRVSVAAAVSPHDGQRTGAPRERGREPVHLLDGMDITRAMPVRYDAVMPDQHRPGKLADWQARG